MAKERIDKVLSHEEMLSRVRAYVEAILKYIQEHPDEDVDQVQFEKNYRKEHGDRTVGSKPAVPRRPGQAVPLTDKDKEYKKW